jgi:phage tail-like protein
LPQGRKIEIEMTTIESSSYPAEFEEFKSIAINTPFLWRRGREEKLQREQQQDVPNSGDGEGEKGERLRFDRYGGISLMPYKTFVRTRNFPVPLAKPIDFALDPYCDIIYILDGETKKVLICDLNSGLTQWVDQIVFSNPKAIQVGKRDIYVLDGSTVLVITKQNFQTSRSFDNIGMNPIYVSLDYHENIFVLDSTENLIYKITNTTGEVSVFFKGEDNEIQFADASDMSIGVRDDNIIVYILNSPKKNILLINADGTIKTSISLGDILHFEPSSLAVQSINNIFVGNKGNEEFPFPRKYSASGKSQPLEYNRPSHKLLLNRRGDVLYIVNLSENWIIKLELVERFVSSAGYISKALDSGIPGIQWHKFILDRDLPDPANDLVEVSYYASDDNSSKDDPPPDESSQWVRALPNPADALILDTRGRYLWFRVRLFSRDNLATPKVRSIRAFLPRLSYLRYLPALYQEDERSKEFLERFLSLFETFFTQNDEEIFSFTKYLDPRATPEGFLPWLASWLALGIDENWSKSSIREFIERAPELYKMRGTRKGIEEIILIYLGDLSEKRSQKMSAYFFDTKGVDLISMNEGAASPQGGNKGSNIDKVMNREYKFMIFESFQLDCIRDNKEYMNLFCADHYTFCVLLNPYLVDKRRLEVIRRIVENEKPAHTVGQVILLQPSFYLGMHTYMGINTQLNNNTFVAGKSSLSMNTAIGTDEQSAQTAHCTEEASSDIVVPHPTPPHD